MKNNNINKTLTANLCTGCGICEGACPLGAISTIVERGNFRPTVNLEKCTNCGRCVKACPGLSVDFNHLSEKYQTNLKSYDQTVGRFEKCYTGYSNDNNVRYHSSSGGMVSQFLIWLLENDKIDGAVVTKFDKSNPLLVKTFVATSKADIISARSSRYSPVSLNKAAQDIKSASGSRYVIVGLPCHIQGIRKLMEIDKKLRDKVIGLFGIYCSGSRSFYMTEYVFKERRINISHIDYLQYRDEGCLGKMVVRMPKEFGKSIKVTNVYSEKISENSNIAFKEHYQSYCHPLRSFFVPSRCNYCIDHYAELADICFGDIHIKPYSDDKIGVNSIIVKNKIWLQLLEACNNSGAVHLDDVDFKTISDSQRMSFVKKGRNGAFINIAKKLGWSVPEYYVDYLRQPTKHDWISFAQTRFQQFLGSHKSMWGLISKLKSKVNVH